MTQWETRSHSDTRGDTSVIAQQRDEGAAIIRRPFALRPITQESREARIGVRVAGLTEPVVPFSTPKLYVAVRGAARRLSLVQVTDTDVGRRMNPALGGCGHKAY